MMVEDNPDDRMIYGNVLCYNGYNVLLVTDGGSAVRIRKAYEPDLILLDIGLFDVNGLDICTELSQSAEGPAIPIVALSAYSGSEMAERARALGCVQYIQKPASPVQLLHIVEQIVGRAPPTGEDPGPRVLTS